MMDTELDISAHVAEREVFFTSMYEAAFPSVARFVQKRGGTLEHAKDIFQDALIIFYEKMSQGVSIASSHEAYVMGIAKHLWIRKFKGDIKNVSLSEDEEMISIPGDFYADVQENKLLALLERSGKKCMELLTAFYYHNVSMNKIRTEFGFGSERSATVQKYKCLEKMRDHVKHNLMTYEDFIE